MDACACAYASTKPIKSHKFAVRLTVSRTISWSHHQLRKSHDKRIHKLIHKYYFGIFGLLKFNSRVLYFFKYWTQQSIFWKANAKLGYHEVITILVKMADWDEGCSDSDADFSEPEFVF